MTPHPPDFLATVVELGFYELAAGIIPLLLLVLFVGEGRIIRGDIQGPDNWRSRALLGLGVIAMMLLGELAALRAVSRGDDSHFLHGVTVIALVSGFTFVFAQGAKLLLLESGEAIPPARQVALGRLYMILVAVVLIASYEILAPGLLPP